MNKSKVNRGYGWVPSLPDHRNYQFAKVAKPFSTQITKVDLRDANMPSPWDQGQLGSCTAHGSGAAVEYLQRKQGLTDFSPSRLFIYYNARDLENATDSDSGAMISDAIKGIVNDGVCDESILPYDVNKFAVKPNAGCYSRALEHKALQYFSVDNTNINEIKAALIEGFPVVAGFTVYDSFESDTVANGGMVPMPSKSESVLGGHCILIVGFDDATQRFTVRNSWGSDWGDKGYCYFPYAYFTDANLADDFWVIKLMEGSVTPTPTPVPPSPTPSPDPTPTPVPPSPTPTPDPTPIPPNVNPFPIGLGKTVLAMTNGKELAAIVCGTLPDGTLNLHTFDTDGQSLGNLTGVGYDATKAADNSWHWPDAMIILTNKDDKTGQISAGCAY